MNTSETSTTTALAPNFKFYQVTAEDIEMDLGVIRLRVDLNRLTVELAHQINNFWSGNRQRLEKESGNVVNVVIRMFGAAAIAHMLADGGADFYASDSEAGHAWTSSTLRKQHEGWPDMEELGILIVEACVTSTEFDTVSVMEVVNG